MDQHSIFRVHLDPARKYRVVQWGTGNIGTRSLRAIIEHPNMTLVGLWVHSEAKAGRDAGEFCGLGAVGVTATQDIDEIIALKPDCVVYMQEGFNFDDVCKLLASGANIATSRWEVNNPAMLDPAIRERVEKACRRGNTSIHGTGSKPGFITAALPLVLLSVQRRLDYLLIEEFVDLSSRNSPGMLFDVMGFGKSPRIPNEHQVPLVRAAEGDELLRLADAISMPLDTIEARAEFATARHTTSIAAGVLETGTVAAQRITISGMRGGRPLMEIRDNWYCTTDIDPSWDLRDTGEHVLLEGDTPMDVNIRFPVPPERYAAFTPGLTAHPVVNAIPFVCAAKPGIRTTLDLPPIVTMLGGPVRGRE